MWAVVVLLDDLVGDAADRLADGIRIHDDRDCSGVGGRVVGLLWVGFSFHLLGVSRDLLKGSEGKWLLGHSFRGGPGLPPGSSVFEHPVEECPLKSDVTAEFLALDPLVTQNLVPLREELPVESGVLQQITRFHWCVGTRH